MGKKAVEILCILDRSGSMGAMMKEVVNALNGFIEDQKKLPGKARMTLCAFDNEFSTIYDRVNIGDVKEIKIADVMPRGMTALYDAIGKTISGAKKDRKTICLIQTDGAENSSSEYSAEQVKNLITEKEKDGWEFVFIGAGIDAFQAGSQFGLTKSQCSTVARSAAGANDMVGVYAATTTAFRAK